MSIRFLSIREHSVRRSMLAQNWDRERINFRWVQIIYPISSPFTFQAGITKEGSFASAYCTLRCAFTLVMGMSGQFLVSIRSQVIPSCVLNGVFRCNGLQDSYFRREWQPRFRFLFSQHNWELQVDCSNMSLPFTVDKYPEVRWTMEIKTTCTVPEPSDSAIFRLRIASDGHSFHYKLPSCRCRAPSSPTSRQ